MFDHKFFQPQAAVEWTAEELKPYFSGMFSERRSSRTLLFVDALDESSNDEMREIAIFFREITDRAHDVDAKLSVCLSSREYPKISVGRCPEIRIDKANTNDIRRYVDQKLETAGVSEDTGWLDMAATIVEKSAGVFLWVVIVLNTMLRDFDDGKNFKYLQRHLRETPPALDQLYAQILSTIDATDSQRTLKFFYWVVFAEKRLRLVEWHQILAWINDEPPASLQAWRDSDYFTETAPQLERKIRSISKGLVEVKTKETQLFVGDSNSICGEAGSLNSEDGETRAVQVIHDSVSDFFLSGKGFDILDHSGYTRGKGDIDIMATCLRYISIPELDSFAKQRDVVQHIRPTHKRTRSEASFGSSASNHSGQYTLRKDRSGPSPPPLFPPGGVDTETTMSEGEGMAPAWNFALERYLRNPILIVESDAVERAATDVESLHSGTVLSQTMETYPAVLSYALDAFPLHAVHADACGADPKSIIDQLNGSMFWQRWLLLAGYPPSTCLLHFAAAKGLTSWAKYLLESGTHPDTAGGEYLYPLIAAAAHGHAETMRLLMRHGARARSQDNSKKAPLHYVAQGGDIELLSCFNDQAPCFKDTKFDKLKQSLETVDDLGRTPLHLSVKNNHVAMTEKLLELGADPNASDDTRMTALHHACESTQPSLASCQLLLDNGTRPSALNDYKLLPCQLAFNTGFLPGVSLLNTYRLSTTKSDLTRSQITVRMKPTTWRYWRARPYVLVRLGGETKVLYNTENTPDTQSWDEVKFLMSFPTKGRLDLELVFAKPENLPEMGIPLFSKSYYVKINGMHLGREKRILSHDLTGLYTSVILEVVVPSGPEAGTVGGIRPTQHSNQTS